MKNALFYVATFIGPIPKLFDRNPAPFVLRNDQGCGVRGVACFQLESKSVFSKLLESKIVFLKLLKSDLGVRRFFLNCMSRSQESEHLL